MELSGQRLIHGGEAIYLQISTIIKKILTTKSIFIATDLETGAQYRRDHCLTHKLGKLMKLSGQGSMDHQPTCFYIATKEEELITTMNQNQH